MRMLKLLSAALMLLFLTGCGQKPFIIFSSDPITQQTQPQSQFQAGRRIHYAAVHPKGFKEGIIKVQIFEKNEKSEFGGYSYLYNRTCKLRHANYCTDYVVLHKNGHYIAQVFYLSNLQAPIALGQFWVRE